MSLQEVVYDLADELRGIASLGLQYSSNSYDKERYEKVLQASSKLIGVLEDREPKEIFLRYQDNLGHTSPLIGAASFIYKDEKVLLIQRTDNEKWSLPGGLVEVGEVLSQAALRELEEETGISGSVIELLGIFDSRIWKSLLKSHLYHVVFLIEPNEEDPKPGPEALNLGYFSEDNLPDLSPGHDVRLPILFQILKGNISKPYFDRNMDSAKFFG